MIPARSMEGVSGSLWIAGVMVPPSFAVVRSLNLRIPVPPAKPTSHPQGCITPLFKDTLTPFKLRFRLVQFLA